MILYFRGCFISEQNLMIVSLKLEIHFEVRDDFPVVLKECEDIFQRCPYINGLIVFYNLLADVSLYSSFVVR